MNEITNEQIKKKVKKGKFRKTHNRVQKTNDKIS